MRYGWYDMGARPLKYDVKCGSKTVIPAGTTGVKIAFEQSNLTYIDDFGVEKRMNVYMLPDGRKYHG